MEQKALWLSALAKIKSRKHERGNTEDKNCSEWDLAQKQIQDRRKK
jgi:hypothetical protein